MRVAFVVERPTQFDAPFFRFAARDPAHVLRVFFTRQSPAGPVWDPELGRSVSWGIDLVAGYEHALLPSGRALSRALSGFELAVVNGYTRAAYLRAAMAARRAGAKTALRIDSVRFDEGPVEAWRRLLVARGLARLFDVFLATGSLTLAYLSSCGVPRENTGLFPYAIDVEDFRLRSSVSPDRRAALRTRLGLPATSRVVLSLTKFSPRETPWDLLRAAVELSDPEVFWVFAGDGPERDKLLRLARHHGLTRACFPGYVPYPELPALYAASDLFVHAAREERWGVSVAEALACGLPVIASSRVGAARDLILSGRNGFTYDAGDAMQLKQRIVEALLSLGREQVEPVNRRLLEGWDYAAAWRGVLAAGEAHA